jgi:SAM-dependent methyltransferase
MASDLLGEGLRSRLTFLNVQSYPQQSAMTGRTTLKKLVGGIPILGPLARKAARRLFGSNCVDIPFSASADYWQLRYQMGGNSGRGSYYNLAEFKAEILNEFVRQQNVDSVIEFGCGDGNQLTYARYPSYLGFDVSPVAIEKCRKLFAADLSKRFELVEKCAGEVADLSMSLDVIYHLVEDATFEAYMANLFAAAKRYVVVYSSNYDSPATVIAPHVRHRCFTNWIERNRPTWRQVSHVPNRYPINPETGEGSFAEFYFFAPK